MTVQEYLKQFSFDDILPPTRKMIEEWRKKRIHIFGQMITNWKNAK